MSSESNKKGLSCIKKHAVAALAFLKLGAKNEAANKHINELNLSGVEELIEKLEAAFKNDEEMLKYQHVIFDISPLSNFPQIIDRKVVSCEQTEDEDIVMDTLSLRNLRENLFYDNLKGKLNLEAPTPCVFCKIKSKFKNLVFKVKNYKKLKLKKNVDKLVEDNFREYLEKGEAV